MSRPRSLRKNLSFNGKAHSSSKSQNSRDWQSTTHMRSFSGVIAAVEKTAPRPEIGLRESILPGVCYYNSYGKLVDRHGQPVEIDVSVNTQEAKLMRHIKKQKRRIDKLKRFISGKNETPGNAELFAETRAKIQKYEGILRFCLGKLQQRLNEKQKVDEREATKFQRAKAIQDGETVRLEDGKMVPRKHIETSFREPTDPGTLTILEKTKRSTSKNPEYREVTVTEIKKRFFEKVNRPAPKTRTLKLKPKKRVRKYGSTQTIITQEGVEPLKRTVEGEIIKRNDNG